MRNISDNELDKLFQSAAQGVQPEFDPEDWEKLSKRLAWNDRVSLYKKIAIYTSVVLLISVLSWWGIQQYRMPDSTNNSMRNKALGTEEASHQDTDVDSQTDSQGEETMAKDSSSQDDLLAQRSSSTDNKVDNSDRKYTDSTSKDIAMPSAREEIASSKGTHDENVNKTGNVDLKNKEARSINTISSSEPSGTPADTHVAKSIKRKKTTNQIREQSTTKDATASINGSSQTLEANVNSIDATNSSVVSKGLSGTVKNQKDAKEMKSLHDENGMTKTSGLNELENKSQEHIANSTSDNSNSDSYTAPNSNAVSNSNSSSNSDSSLESNASRSRSEHVSKEGAAHDSNIATDIHGVNRTTKNDSTNNAPIGDTKIDLLKSNISISEDKKLNAKSGSYNNSNVSHDASSVASVTENDTTDNASIGDRENDLSINNSQISGDKKLNDKSVSSDNSNVSQEASSVASVTENDTTDNAPIGDKENDLSINNSQISGDKKLNAKSVASDSDVSKKTSGIASVTENDARSSSLQRDSLSGKVYIPVDAKNKNLQKSSKSNSYGLDERTNHLSKTDSVNIAKDYSSDKSSQAGKVRQLPTDQIANEDFQGDTLHARNGTRKSGAITGSNNSSPDKNASAINKSIADEQLSSASIVNSRDSVEKEFDRTPSSISNSGDHKTIASEKDSLDVKADSIARKITGESLDTTAQKKKQHIASKWYIKLLVSPDFTAIGYNKPGKAGVNAGLMVEYSPMKHWGISIGGIWSKKLYGMNDPGKSYNYGGASFDADYLDGDCRVLDIPINITYYIMPESRLNFYISGGVSSYIMLKENYVYTVWENNTNYYYYENYNNKNNNWFSMLNLSFGLQYRMNNRFMFQVEPFLKAPVAGVGEGKVDLVSIGSFFSLKYKITK
ncbi:outer membrane beta-barrel protein [Ohtaekwangia koreensis]|uniref:Outer membrane protein beta-barrel domain-containing protein n=1 Tax=Ohtaekwangia koreensis TaxID=688867 RepID=A0A1T5K103_9BACT|nr:outer membrane beta-barrel protein [Ohtaekwangia koreensis]SKC57284.1 Outer membrane protein beta-barrel domain-containing protein [Ohtaekwangia koreensis]